MCLFLMDLLMFLKHTWVAAFEASLFRNKWQFVLDNLTIKCYSYLTLSNLNNNNEIHNNIGNPEGDFEVEKSL